MLKGIYPHDGNRFRVRKYDKHIGVFETYEEAKQAAVQADKKHIEQMYLRQYVTSKKWLKEHGLL